MDSRIGPLYLVASKRGLAGVFWKKQNAPMAGSLKGVAAEPKILSKAVRQIGEYLAGRRRKFALSLAAEGTTFQKSVWKELRRIPYAATCSYRDVASHIRNAKAVRAVGTANGRNPLCIIVPCHRVIPSSGGIGGYSGPAGVKNKLLTLERTGQLPR